MRFFILIRLIILFFLCDFCFIHAQTIVFDESHQPAWLLRDTGVCGYSTLYIELRKQGYQPVSSTVSFTELPHLIPKDSLVITGISKFQEYLTSEIHCMKKFVEKGGNLLVIGEHEDAYLSSSKFQNILLSPFGLSFENNLIVESGNDWIEIVTPDNPSVQARFYASPRINGQGNIYSMSKQSRIPVCVMKNYHKGKVIALADSEFYFNGSKNFGLKDQNNLHYFLALIQKILPLSQNKNPFLINHKNPDIGFIDDFGCISSSEQIDGYSQFLEFLTKENFRIASGNFKDPLIQNCSTWIIVSPLEKFSPEFLKISDEKKLLLIGDYYSKIQGLANNEIILSLLGISEKGISPLNQLSMRKGITFQPWCPMDFSSNFHSDPYQIDMGIILYRSSSIQSMLTPVDSVSFPATTFFNPVCLGLDERVPYSETINKNGYFYQDENSDNCRSHPEIIKIQKTNWDKMKSQIQKDSLYFMVETSDFMGIGDQEWLNNQHFQRNRKSIFVRKIMDFLRKSQ